MKSKEQSFWVSFAFITIILVGGAGYFLVNSSGKYQNSQGGFVAKATKLRGLERADLYPSEENLQILTEQIDKFEVEVNSVHDQLKGFQKPLPVVSDQEFPPQLRAAKEEFERYAVKNRVVTPQDFYLGMGTYQFQLPRPEATGILAYELDAIQHILKIIVDNGADEIYSLEREQTAVELGQPDPEKTDRVVKYTFKVGFQTTHQGFQDFLNKVSNDKEYFFIVRVLRVDNEEKVGPEKIVAQTRVFRDQDGNVVTDVPVDDEGNPIGSDEYVVEDAAVIFGDEMLRVTAVIDLCRFPEVAAAPSES